LQSTVINSPIGIFDSGIGGLTVARSVMELLPNENIIYFGDTARVPYGIKSRETISRYSREITRFLKRKRVKAILIACNTVSAVAREDVQNEAKNIPVLDVIAAGTKAAMVSGARNIGVIGTLATIASGAYDQALKNQNSALKVVGRACPLLVPLAEEGWTENEIALKILHIYLDEFSNNTVDALILGCTHYPLFKKSIQSIFQSEKINIIDSAEAIADMTSQLLIREKILNEQTQNGIFKCYVTDRPQRFQELAERFLGHRIPEVEVLELQ